MAYLGKHIPGSKACLAHDLEKLAVDVNISTDRLETILEGASSVGSVVLHAAGRLERNYRLPSQT